MNGEPLRVIIGVVILAIIVYVVIFIMQRSIIKNVDELQTKKRKLIELDTKEDLLDGKKLSLTGQSLKKFDDLQLEYEQIEKDDFKQFDQAADDLLFEAKGWNVIRSKQSLKDLTAVLDGIATRIVEVRKGIETLKQMDAEHRAAVKKLEVEYQALRKTLLTKNFEFGDAIDKLEEILAALEDDFDEFTHLTEQGDHTAAADIYTQLHSETERLEGIIDRIPDIQKQVQVDFPAQVKELQASYNLLTSDGYIFSNKRLQVDIAGVEASRIITNNLIRELEIDDAATNVEHISKQIDDLYTQMQMEMDAKKVAVKKNKQVEQFINHARHQNHLLMIELDRIGQRYILTDKQESRTQAFAERIKQIETDYRQIILDIQFNKAVYLNVAKKFQVSEDELTDIELKQQAIWEDLQTLSIEEGHAQSSLEKVAFELRDIKREVEHWNLPGLPESYKQKYQSLNNQIDRLDRTFQGSHLNMNDVVNSLGNIQNDMNELSDSTKILYNDARLAEQFFQYANRYRLKNQNVAAAYNEALNAYQNHFDFSYAQQILGQALEQIEPGIIEKIKTQL